MDRNAAVLLTALAVILTIVHFLPIILIGLAVGWGWKVLEKRT